MDAGNFMIKAKLSKTSKMERESIRMATSKYKTPLLVTIETIFNIRGLLFMDTDESHFIKTKMFHKVDFDEIEVVNVEIDRIMTINGVWLLVEKQYSGLQRLIFTNKMKMGGLFIGLIMIIETFVFSMSLRWFIERYQKQVALEKELLLKQGENDSAKPFDSKKE